MSTARIAAVALGACMAIAAVPAHAQRAVFVVRHAEKVDESKDAALTAAGERRAAALATALHDAGVTAIYTTPLRRTRGTAAPLAKALKLEPVESSLPPEALVQRLRKEHADDVVLVVGHHNTVPLWLKALGHPNAVTLSTDEYTNLFAVVPQASGPPVVLRLRY